VLALCLRERLSGHRFRKGLYSKKAVGQYSGAQVPRDDAEFGQYPGFYLRLDYTNTVQRPTSQGLGSNAK
jgi:hypothetical protein